MHTISPILIFIWCLSLSVSATANNGELAKAYPISSITIDGNLSDWPDDFVKYPIERSQNRFNPVDTDDFSAWFAVGYNRAT